MENIAATTAPAKTVCAGVGAAPVQDLTISKAATLCPACKRPATTRKGLIRWHKS